nr:hypothetical protein L203_00843 [Cryptococcus depauperatus CBS 7841]
MEHHYPTDLNPTDDSNTDHDTAEPFGNPAASQLPSQITFEEYLASMEPEDTTGWYQPPSNPHTRPDGSEQFYVSKSDYDAMVAGLRLKIAGLTQERNNAKRCLLEQNEVTTMLLANLRNRDETIAAQKNMLDTYYSCYGPIPETVTGSGEQTTMPSAVRHANTGNSHPASRPHAASSGAIHSNGGNGRNSTVNLAEATQQRPTTQAILEDKEGERIRRARQGASDRAHGWLRTTRVEEDWAERQRKTVSYLLDMDALRIHVGRPFCTGQTVVDTG